MFPDPVRILGIDAAWTERADSGIAMIEADRNGRHLTVAPRTGKSFDEELAQRPTVVAVDMPLSRTPICRRRSADNAVASCFGRQKAGVHSPTAGRPGEHGARMHRILAKYGYELATSATPRPAYVVIEVFPLAALVRLMRLDERPPYKVAKSARYWPMLSKRDRRLKLLEQWQRIEAMLASEIALRASLIPDAFLEMTVKELKAYEDAIDAVICALVGAYYLADRAEAFGDVDAAIWIPQVT